jgi:hypothetical protein
LVERVTCKRLQPEVWACRAQQKKGQPGGLPFCA